ncbi:MAG: response regulator [Acidobacteriota bacterium]
MIPAARENSQIPSQRPHVLLIEDEEDHAALIDRAFAARSDFMRCTLARNLRDARQVIEHSPPELVISDLLLPDGRGIDLLPNAGQRAHFPVVIMTGHGDEGVAAEAFRAGAMDYVVKSAASLVEMPMIAEKALCAWRQKMDQQRAEQALLASALYYRELYNEMPSMSFAVNRSSEIVAANHFAATRLGYKVEELAKLSLGSLFRAKEGGSATQHLEACFQQPETLRRWRESALCKDGIAISLRITARVVTGETGEKVALIVGDEQPEETHNLLSTTNEPSSYSWNDEVPVPTAQSSIAHATYRILAVDDDPINRHLTHATLTAAGFKVWTAASGREALALLEQRGLPHLAVVDLVMPEMSGYRLCSQLQEFTDLPIIALTSVDDSATVAKALRTFAEDYIRKPFQPVEFVARIECLLRRIGDFGYTLERKIRVDDRLTVEFARRTAYIEGNKVELTPTETKLLYILMRNAGHTVVSDYLIRRVWPLADVYEEALRTHIYRLRRKIEVSPTRPKYVITRRGFGYSFAQLKR